MKVIFLEDVAGAADAGEVKEVKNGFARNYLLPRGLAAPATPGPVPAHTRYRGGRRVRSASSSPRSGGRSPR